MPEIYIAGVINMDLVFVNVLEIASQFKVIKPLRLMVVSLDVTIQNVNEDFLLEQIHFLKNILLFLYNYVQKLLSVVYTVNLI